MNKINFQNLPSTTTPVNATNLNQVQTNIENEFNNLENITTNEVVIGSWEDLNGTTKPLYRKMLFLEVPTGSVNKNYAHNISNIKYICNYKASMLKTGINYKLPYVAGSVYTQVESIGQTNIVLKNNTDWSTYTLQVILEYTKTTD